MQPFTLDQAIITGMLFILGVLIGMFLLAGGKWKRRYAAESARVAELERENTRLVSDMREYELTRTAAPAAAPVVATPVRHEEVRHEEVRREEVRPVQHEEVRTTTTTTPVAAEPYRRVDTSRDAKPDIVIRRD